MALDAPRFPLLDRLKGLLGRHGTNGHALQTKGLELDPSIMFTGWENGQGMIRLVGDGASSEAEHVSRATAYCAAAYAFTAMRFRASRLAEPPLMVIQEDPTDGSEDWLPNHALAPLLDAPSPDYDMGELLFRTSIYVDRDGHALWLKDANGLGRPGRLTPYAGCEFLIQSTADRLRGRFVLQTARGEQRVQPEQVIYFHEPDPTNWLQGQSRLDVFLGWLNLGQVARATVRDLLANAVWPSVILMPDKDWNPEPAEFEEYKRRAKEYSQPGQRGGALPMLGGGTAQVVSARVRDLVPDEVLNRVESIAASVFGIPAIVLQFLVGMENAPWSQMAEARRMCYEDTIEPMWREYEKRLTRQLLRPLDQDTAHLVRFDTSKIRALFQDEQKTATTVSLWGTVASVNEKRNKLGLELSDDPAADEIPALRPAPTFTQADPNAQPDPNQQDAAAKARREVLAATLRTWAKDLRGIPPSERTSDELAREIRDGLKAIAQKAPQPIDLHVQVAAPTKKKIRVTNAKGERLTGVVSEE